MYLGGPSVSQRTDFGFLEDRWGFGRGPLPDMFHSDSLHYVESLRGPYIVII